MKYEYNGRLCTVTELAKIAGVSLPTMCWRLSERRTVEEAVHLKSKREPKHYRYKGEMLTVPEISGRTGYSKVYLYELAKKGGGLEDILLKKAERRKKVRNITKMLEYAGIPRASFYTALHRGETLKNILLKKEERRRNLRNIIKMLEYAGIPRASFYTALRRGATLKEFFYGEK